MTPERKRERRESWIRLKAKAEQARVERDRSRKRLEVAMQELRELAGRG